MTPEQIPPNISANNEANGMRSLSESTPTEDAVVAYTGLALESPYGIYEKLPAEDEPESGQPIQNGEQLNPPQLNFIFWEHIPSNAKEAAALIGDSQVVALEYVTDDEKKRQAFEQAATDYISSTATPDARQQAMQVLQKLGDQWGTYIALFDELSGTDKQIVTVDIDTNSQPKGSLKEINNSEWSLYSKEFRQLHSSKIKPHLLQYAKLIAKENATREGVIESQLDRLAGELSGQTKSIAILLGALHTPVYHNISRKWPSQRTFIRNTDIPGVRFTHDNGSARITVRELRFHPEQPPTDVYINKHILDNSHPPQEGEATLSDGMSSEDIAALLTELDRVKQGPLGKVLPLRKRRADRIITKHRATKKHTEEDYGSNSSS